MIRQITALEQHNDNDETTIFIFLCVVTLLLMPVFRIPTLLCTLAALRVFVCQW